MLTFTLILTFTEDLTGHSVKLGIDLLKQLFDLFHATKIKHTN